MDDAIASLNLNVEDNFDSIQSKASQLMGDAKDSMQGMADKFGQKARGMVQKTGDAAHQFVNEASRIPENLLNDPPQYSTNGFPDTNQIKQGVENIAASLPKAPELLSGGSGNANRDQQLMDQLKNTIGNVASGSSTSSPAPLNKTPDNSFAANLSGSRTATPLPGMVNVKPRSTSSDFVGFENQSISRENMIRDANVLPVSTATRTLDAAWPEIDAMVRKRNFSEALTELTSFYDSPVHASDKKLLKWLDLLAAKVIYSPENLLRSRPYVVQPGDKIADLARRWKVPAQLIYNTNRQKIADPNNMRPGTQLKIIQGPFDAVVDSSNGLMTLFLQGMYAGRFDISGGNAIPQGDFQIVNKSVASKAGMPHWISLSNGTNIYGSDRSVQGGDVGLSPNDAADVFAILSAASKVRVLR